MCLNEITSTHQTWKDFQDILSGEKKKVAKHHSRKRLRGQTIVYNMVLFLK